MGLGTGCEPGGACQGGRERSLSREQKRGGVAAEVVSRDCGDVGYAVLRADFLVGSERILTCSFCLLGSGGRFRIQKHSATHALDDECPVRPRG